MNNGAEQDRIEKIRAQFEGDPALFLSKTLDLHDSDFSLIGRVIQLYCYADLNARRIVDSLRHAAFGPDARYGSQLQDAQVFPKLREIAGELWHCNLKDGLLKAADTVELHRVHRHNFAHWAARRVREEEALVLFTKNAREAQRRDGQPQTPEEVKYAIVWLGHFPDEVSKLQAHTQYLAESAAHVELNLEQFRSEFAKHRRDPTS